MILNRRRHLLAFSLFTLLAMSGCDMLKQRDVVPKTGSLTQRFTMIDSDGRQYGVVEIDPINGGKITDVQGRLVGYITPPAQPPQSTAIPQQPVLSPQVDNSMMGVAPLPPTASPYR